MTISAEAAVGDGAPEARSGVPVWLHAAPPIVRSRAKRALDTVGGALCMMAAAPLALVIALLIKLDSRGPVLYRQERCGFRGERFTCLKFRSMRVDADEGPHRRYVRDLVTGRAEKTNGAGVYKLVDDERVTRVGAFLRRTSLDELPQLWNVVRGEMSLVGPRPPLPYEVELYDAQQLRRLECRPGLTGLWQVSGRNGVSYRDMCRMDLEYLERWSLGMDLRILARTVPVVLMNSGRAQ